MIFNSNGYNQSFDGIFLFRWAPDFNPVILVFEGQEFLLCMRMKNTREEGQVPLSSLTAWVYIMGSKEEAER